MAWQTTQFERSALYEEIWKEPVTKVSKKYRLSDVGLRKICKKLNIPLPPLGYWARIQAGQPVTKPPLGPTKGPTSYAHRWYEEPHDEELESMLQSSLALQRPLPAIAPIPLRTSLDDCLPIVRRAANQLKRASKDDRGWPSVLVSNVVGVSVSPGLQERALFALNLLLEAANSAGFQVVAPRGEDQPGHLDVLGQRIRIHIHENSRREERALTAEEIEEKKLRSYVYIPNRYIWHPTGKLKITISRLDGGSWESFEVRDSASEPIEARVPAMPQQLLEFSVRLTVLDELKKKRAEEQKLREAEHSARLAVRRKELETLKKVEKQAQDWERAQRLRAYARAMEEANNPIIDEVRRREIEWIVNAADWLDPAIGKPWPEVDVYDYSVSRSLYDQLFK